MSRRLYLIFHGRYPSEKAAALFAAKSAEAFTREGYIVTVLAPRRFGLSRNESGTVYLPTLDAFKILPHALAFRVSLIVFSVSAYGYLWFRARKSDLVYSNESLPLFFTTFSFSHAIYELHDYPERIRFFYHALLSRVSGVVVTNELKRKRLETEYPCTKGKTLVEKNAVSLEQFSISVSREEARRALHLPLHAKIAVYTGHLYSWKGVDTLAGAAKHLGDSQIYIVGGTAEDVAKYKSTWGSEENLHFVGYRPHAEIPLWQKAADVLVLPNTARERISVESTSPMKLFEYMASGTPIVASQLPSIVEVVGENAFFFEPDNATALAQVMTEVLRTQNASTKAAGALTTVLEHTWEKRARRILSWLVTLHDASQHYRHERSIFWASIAVSLIFILAFVFSHGVQPPLSSVNSDGYIPLAIALYENYSFTYSTTTPFIPEATHTPGYPLFLAFTAAPWGNVLPALVIQILLLAFSAVLLYRLFEGVFSPQVRFWGALVFGVEPYTTFTAAQPLSEALFLALFIGGLLVLRRAFQRELPLLFFVSGAILAASALVRPIAEYLLPLIVVAAVGSFYVLRKKQLLTACAALMFGMLILLAPWAYRNHEAFGVWTVSTKGAFSLYFYDAAEVLKYKENISAEAVTAELLQRAHERFPEVSSTEDLRSLKYASYLTSESLSIIKQSPQLFVKMYLASLGTFFLSDGYRLLWYEASNGAITLPNITRAIVMGDLGTLKNYFSEQPLQAILFVLGFVFWAGAFMLAVIGSVAGLASRTIVVRWAVLAALVCMAYFAILTGPLAQARYRIVVTPFLFMLASYGAALILTHFYVHRRIA